VCSTPSLPRHHFFVERRRVCRVGYSSAERGARSSLTRGSASSSQLTVPPSLPPQIQHPDYHPCLLLDFGRYLPRVSLLNQIIAVEPRVKSGAYSLITKLHHDTQRTQQGGPFFGLTRTYTPLVAVEDGGEDLPGESTRVQMTIGGILTQIAEASTKLWDLIATKDWANCEANADIVVDGTTVMEKVPVTYLLFLEKQLKDLRTIISKLPTLDLAETWHYDHARGCWATEPVRTQRTKKVMQNHVLAAATDKHPAQVQAYTVDEIVGYWATTKFSGALSADRVELLLKRVEALAEAVAFAREQANTMDVTERKVAAPLFEYLFAG